MPTENVVGHEGGFVPEENDALVPGFVFVVEFGKRSGECLFPWCDGATGEFETPCDLGAGHRSEPFADSAEGAFLFSEERVGVSVHLGSELSRGA